MKSPTQNRGFTLVELLVTIAIIAVLAALVLPITRKAKEAGLSAACASNFRNIGAAIFQYAADNDGFIPPGQSLDHTTTTGLFTPSPGVSQPNLKAFLAWVYQDIVHDTTPAGQPIKGFACPAAMVKWPGLRHPTTKNFLNIYYLNPRVGTSGPEQQPLFGYWPGYIPTQIPMRLVAANAAAIADPDPRKDQRWFFQESDELGGVGASWDRVNLPPGPAHGNHRYRLCLDGHVERLTLAETNIDVPY